MCNTFRWSRKTQNHDSRSSLWKSHLQKGETEQRKKIRILLKMAKCATFLKKYLFLCSRQPPSQQRLLKTTCTIFLSFFLKKEMVLRQWCIASLRLKQRNFRNSLRELVCFWFVFLKLVFLKVMPSTAPCIVTWLWVFASPGVVLCFKVCW